jgi:hypothetical protein
MHENALHRLGGAPMGAPSPLPEQWVGAGIDRPRVAFSEVLIFDINGESIHVVHQPAGYSDWDALTHFHRANLIYLGDSYPGDSYPYVDVNLGGTVDGLLQTLAPWTKADMRIVPFRGGLKRGSDVAAFQRMIIAARDRVRAMKMSGLTVEQAIDARPTADFDAKWGHGAVAPADFVRQLYASLP